MSRHTSIGACQVPWSSTMPMPLNLQPPKNLHDTNQNKKINKLSFAIEPCAKSAIVPVAGCVSATSQ
ncbi:hypothetical protein COCSADRAFT_34496 [Bipolaris sorokiniana ND90Pr]|uniref:Uncharacterized protein n=1 Tax=Cochliobolus sativus (strain ND90Pr / ATCC 201652) TaxID=665912 RepID=M2TG44_COCSN|nr:uncharacterized protein COCSADRAFT_34496 [Bipolaris sorokiniana ND90Pr]EMD67702.1 hypothetical protein COCSADRAFT_34496 [Bipolaris sorokiniana ND90Pr]